MRPRRRAAVTVAVLVGGSALLVGWLRVLPAVREREAARAFAALAVCLAGPERTAPEEAAVRAGRLHHPRAKVASLVRCQEPAYALARSRGVRAVAPALAAEAEIAAHSLSGGELPGNLIALWRAAEHLRWMPEPGLTRDQEHAPTPLLDAQLPDLRRALPGLEFFHDQNDRRIVDVQPLDRAVVGVGPRALAVEASADGEPLAVPLWKAAERPAHWYASTAEGHVTLRDPAGHVHDLGPGTAPLVLGERVLWMLDGKLQARRLDADGARAEAVADVPAGKGDVRYRSCHTRAGDVLAVETDDAVHVMRLRDGHAEPWGTFAMAHPEPPARAGTLGMTCDDAGARLAWALSEPAGDAHIAMNGAVTLPEGEGHHRITAVACDPRGCSRREATAGGIDVGWRSTGGWSSAVYMNVPDVFDLGARVLVVWDNGTSIRYRLAALDALDHAPSLWLAATYRPQDREPLDPRSIAWPRWQIHARGGVALVLVQEWGVKDNASFLVRFDSTGQARVLEPPARP
ncbi:MAG: hypothetical protein QM820_54560 [Minicystis sp.]